MTLKTFRDEKANSDKVNYHKGVLSGGSRTYSREYNSLYCTNRTSLENSFYATRDSIYTKEAEGTGM